MSKNDEKIKELMNIVQEKRENLGQKPKTAWLTNGIFKFDDGKTHLNLNTVHDEKILVEALSHLFAKNYSTSEAAKILKIEKPVFEYDGYSVDDWIADFKLRKSQIDWDNEKRKLSKLEDKLNSLISKDAKTAMELEKIKNILEE